MLLCGEGFVVLLSGRVDGCKYVSPNRGSVGVFSL